MTAKQKTEVADFESRSYSRKEVVEIIRSVLKSIDENNPPTEKLHQELSALASYMGNMRS